MESQLAVTQSGGSAGVLTPAVIVALDVPTAENARALVARLPRADFFKVGLELYTAAGPDIVRELRDSGKQVFLDLKLHDIPNTVTGAVRCAAKLQVDLLTVHVSGGATMLRACVEAAADSTHDLRLLGMTVLTSLSAAELAQAWGRERVDMLDEVSRLARVADEVGLYGVVCSVQEIAAVRRETRANFPVLTPGIRLAGDAINDQTRIATPYSAARGGADFIVIGRSVTAARDPGAAYDEVLAQLSNPGESSS